MKIYSPRVVGKEMSEGVFEVKIIGLYDTLDRIPVKLVFADKADLSHFIYEIVRTKEAAALKGLK